MNTRHHQCCDSTQSMRSNWNIFVFLCFIAVSSTPVVHSITQATWQACPPNVYCEGENRTDCPAFSESPAQSILKTDCVCKAGYSGPNGGPCVACTTTTYCPGGTIAPQSCPTHFLWLHRQAQPHPRVNARPGILAQMVALVVCVQ